MEASDEVDGLLARLGPALAVARKLAAHGDYACNLAMQLAKPLSRKPREIAEKLVKALPASSKVAKVEIAGAGFINFFLTPTAFHDVIREILDAGKAYGRSNAGQGRPVQVEFVSANPTGPLHVGHGRGAALGDDDAAF